MPSRDYVVDQPALSKGYIEMYIGKKRVGSVLLADQIKRCGEVNMEHIHALVFLAFCGAKGGVISGEDALRDDGLVHRGVHLALDIPFVGDNLDKFCDSIRGFEEQLAIVYPWRYRSIRYGKK